MEDQFFSLVTSSLRNCVAALKASQAVLQRRPTMTDAVKVDTFQRLENRMRHEEARTSPGTVVACLCRLVGWSGDQPTNNMLVTISWLVMQTNQLSPGCVGLPRPHGCREPAAKDLTVSVVLSLTHVRRQSSRGSIGVVDFLSKHGVSLYAKGCTTSVVLSLAYVCSRRSRGSPGRTSASTWPSSA